jgi:predicted nucleic acid-binding protein
MAEIERVVLNASPLIALLAIRQEGLLPALFAEVLLPPAVREEIEAGWLKDPNVARLERLTWPIMPPAEPIPETVLGWGLGRGESSVLALAHRVGCTAVLDDLAARRCARFLGVPVVGTGRLLVLAKQRKLIPSVRDQLDQLRANGFRLSKRLSAKLLAESGEAE